MSSNAPSPEADAEAARLDALVASAMDGSAEAFGTLWKLLSPRVAGYLRSRGVEAVDDVTSDVFLAAYGGLAGFVGGGSSFRSWIFTLAHHKAVDHWRRARILDPLDEESDPRRSPSPEEALGLSWEGDEVLQLLSRLTPTQREIMTLRVLGELRIEEIAELLTTSPEAVRQAQKRAIATLRSALGSTEAGGISPVETAPKGLIPRQGVPNSSPSAIAPMP